VPTTPGSIDSSAGECLGAALVDFRTGLGSADRLPAAIEFVTLDRQQALAAEGEGFHVLGP